MLNPNSNESFSTLSEGVNHRKKKIKVEAQIKYISHRNAVKYNTEWL